MGAWRGAGYYLMGPVADDVPTDPRLPRPVWSISTCVADSYPDANCLEWVRTTPERDRELREALGLSAEALAGLKAEVTDLFDRGLVRWPNVFATVSAAREFHGRWLPHLPGVRLLGISLHESDVPGFLADVAPSSNPGDGVPNLLAEGRPPADGGALRGFEVLGADFGSFHTYLCHGMDAELMDDLSVRFNDHGLIEEWTAARRASDWIGGDEVGAEPVPWYPWRIDEYPLE